MGNVLSGIPTLSLAPSLIWHAKPRTVGNDGDWLLGQLESGTPQKVQVMNPWGRAHASQAGKLAVLPPPLPILHH